jgi:putative membrane-bound dehydrogenase-like protein
MALAALLVCGCAVGKPAPASAPAPAQRAEVPLRLPPGFVAERVAGPPQVNHPMTACFDERGRLFVTEAAGVNRTGEELVRDPPNSILLLQGRDGKGRFERVSVFADHMTFPAGVLWHDGGLYTASAPFIWRLEDAKGLGVADVRRPLVGQFHFTGIADDIHGPFLGPDGWLYWCEGCHGHDVRQPDGVQSSGQAARIFRCRPDGSKLETVCGGGMNNPVELVFTPEGEPLATVNILRPHPRVDGLIYCIEGGVYPYRDVYKELKQTGDLLPPVADLGWVAVSGLVRYEGNAFGSEYEGNLFATEFNTHRVRRHVLTRDGASFRVRSEDFLVSTDTDFHPTDVLEDADGSLLVLDTGGWFRNGCPNSQIAKPEFKGAIYRVRRENAPAAADPRGLTVAWEKLSAPELARLLDDSRFVVRDRAIAESARRPSAVEVLQTVVVNCESARARRNAVWALTRIDRPEARAAVRAAMIDMDYSVCLAAAHSAGLLRDADAEQRLVEMLLPRDAGIRRAAATALGRLRRAISVPKLFDAMRTGGDRFLEHALIYAVISIGDRAETLRGLSDPNPVVRRAALIALDQMDGGGLTRELVTPLLNTGDPALLRAALDVITRRPGWAQETHGLLRGWLAGPDLPTGARENLQGVVVAFAGDQAVQALVAEALQREKTSTELRLVLLESIARAPLNRLPACWVREVGRALHHPDPRVVRQAVECVRAGRVTELDQALLALAEDPARDADLRVAAVAAVDGRVQALAPAVFDFLIARLDREVATMSRLGAAAALGGSRLSDEQLMRLTEVLARAASMEVPHLLGAFEHCRSSDVGKKLMAVLSRIPRQPLPRDTWKRLLRQYPQEVRQEAERLLPGRLKDNLGKQDFKVLALEPLLGQGDPGRGRAVFMGNKAACSACHTISGEGGRVGPDLSHIGGIRSARDLLEAVVLPSASFARGYEPYVVATRDGKFQTGLIARQTADAIYLIAADRAEVRVSRADIESLEPGTVSIMPGGLDVLLSQQELVDVIAYLRSLR